LDARVARIRKRAAPGGRLMTAPRERPDEPPKTADGRTVAFWLAMLVPFGMIALGAAVLFAILRVLFR
jgi:hypothetical protein